MNVIKEKVGRLEVVCLLKTHFNPTLPISSTPLKVIKKKSPWAVDGSVVKSTS